MIPSGSEQFDVYGVLARFYTHTHILTSDAIEKV